MSHATAALLHGVPATAHKPHGYLGPAAARIAATPAVQHVMSFLILAVVVVLIISVVGRLLSRSS